MNFMKLSGEQLAYGINTGCSGVSVTPCNILEEAAASVLNPEDRGGKLMSLKMWVPVHQNVGTSPPKYITSHLRKQ